MGVFTNQETHVKRSSSMSFALRWKHENLRLIMTIALVSCAIAFMFLVLLYGASAKSVSVVVNGQEHQVKTRAFVLQRLLDEQAITVGPHDRVSAPLDSKLSDGMRITIDHAKPIQLTADGETKTVFTTGKTVESALQDLNIKVGEFDKVSPSPDTGIVDNASVKIVRVKKELADVTEPIAFDTQTKDDATLPKGEEKVVQEGKAGVLSKKMEKVFEDGVLVSQNIVSKTVAQESVNKVVAVGTKKPVTVLSASSPDADAVSKSGITFNYKQILNNVTLTAYSAGPSSTGKSEGSSGFGKTFTGTTVTEGRTIAVDPRVIPLGWWVYIDGVGFRRAEDTGGAVKGNTIDVYYESDDYANRFGTKRGYTVYVIGPKKPTEE